MKVYTDSRHRIIDIGSTANPCLTELEVPDWTFGDISDSQIKCYSCIQDKEGNTSIQLLVPVGVLEQIGDLDRQRHTDLEEIATLTELVVDNDYRIATIELGL